MNYRRKIYMGIIIIALGVSLNTTLLADYGSVGTVLIAIGGLFFISGMAAKKKADETRTE